MTLRYLAATAAVLSFSAPAFASPELMGVGNYVGVGANFNRQGVAGPEYSPNRTIAGGTVQSRFSGLVSGVSVSARPFANVAAGPDSQIAAAAGVFGTVDISLAGFNIGDTYVSNTNLYLGVGGQWAMTNDGQANYQTSIGKGSQVLFVTGVERALTPNLVGFADIKFPVQQNGVPGTNYAPVGTLGLGFKF